MSLWTPDGEHPVGRDDELDDARGPAYDDIDELDPETAARLTEQLAQAQAQLLAAPVGQVVANHAMGLFELAALHLRAEEPDLDAARLAIDAMGLLVDQLGDRLADHDTLAAALTQLRMAYVEVRKHVDAGSSTTSDDADDADDALDDDALDDDALEDDADVISEADFLD